MPCSPPSFRSLSKTTTKAEHGMSHQTRWSGTHNNVTRATGTTRFYDTNRRLVLVDSGNFRFAFDINYNGTPGDVGDDQDVPDSFRIIRASTGRNIEGRDFCQDLVEFTS